MKKIVYLMNVDWGWIKQRPHFIAENLSNEYDTVIVFCYRYKRESLQKRDNTDLNLKPVFVIPKISSIQYLSWINELIFKCQVKRIIKKSKPDYLYITDPRQVLLISNEFSGHIIYDCMDNHVAFTDDNDLKKLIVDCESILIEKAEYIFVSSTNLLEVMQNQYKNFANKMKLVRNAFDGKIVDVNDKTNDNQTLKMAYVGTISNWFDWKNILAVMNERDDVELHLFGPVDKTSIPDNSRIFYKGIVEHDELYQSIKGMDVLLMPFTVNEIVEAVDPVKIYEYINFGKDIIMCKYPEVQRFDEFVYFYDDAKEFCEAIDNIQKNKRKYSDERRISFLNENSWNQRFKQIKDIIETDIQN